MNHLFTSFILFVFFITPKINYAQESIQLDSAVYYSIQTKLNGICNKLPISYPTEDLLIEKVMHSFFSKYPINKEIAVSQKQFIADFGIFVQKAEAELNDTTKYFWTIEKQLKNLVLVKNIISVEKITIDNPLKFTKLFNTELILQFPLGFKDLTKSNKELLLSNLFFEVLNDYKGDTIELEELDNN